MSLFCFSSLGSDGCFFPPRKMNLSPFCVSQPILKLLSGRLFKGSSSGTFTLRLFMNSASSKLASLTKINIYFSQTTHRPVCRKTHSLMSIYQKLSADNFEGSWSLQSYGLGRIHFKGRDALQTVDTHEMFFSVK